MSDMASTIVPKSDQLNADDLIAGTKTITITGVSIKSGEQPISIHYEGDGGKPYKACKSMCRVMVTAWGADSKAYVGRSMTLYRDPSVTWAGMAVGGIRISHMSDIDSKITMALTATKQSRKPYTVQPLKAATKQPAAAQVAQTDRASGKSAAAEDTEGHGFESHSASAADPTPTGMLNIGGKSYGPAKISVEEAIALETRCKESDIKPENVKKFFKVTAFDQLTPAQLVVAHENITVTLAKRMEAQ